MRNPWLEVLDRVLKPARPDFGRCEKTQILHVVAWSLFAEELQKRMAECEGRINGMRADVFATNDGIVGKRMTELEREWLTLRQRSTDLGVMDLWARLVPPSWIDRKRFRDTALPLRHDAMIALASDVDGVERAEAAVRVLRPNARVRWRMMEKDVSLPLVSFDGTATDRAIERARRIEVRVRTAAVERFPSRPLLAEDIAHASFVDAVTHFSGAERSPMLDALRTLWSTGYVASDVTDDWVTLEIPRL